MNIPNKLTIFRMIMIIPFITFLSIPLVNNHQSFGYDAMTQNTIYFIVAGLIFAISMFTDFLDGYIARKYNLVTTFGKLFDPLADKFMTTSALILLSIYQIVPVWIVIIFVLRDILVDGARNLAASNDLNVAASIWGKVKTMIQSWAIIILIFIVPILDVKSRSFESYVAINTWRLALLNIPLFIAAFFSIFSAIDYLKQVSPLLKTK